MQVDKFLSQPGCIMNESPAAGAFGKGGNTLTTLYPLTVKYETTVLDTP